MKHTVAQKLNRRIIVERLVDLQDEFGQPVQQWVEHCRLWADFMTLTGRGFMTQEFFSGGSEVSRPTASIRIRRRTDITPQMRIRYNGQIYEIRVVLPDTTDNRYVDLGVATGANNG